jgi:vanillate O-demethylase ferredoxin subunit
MTTNNGFLVTCIRSKREVQVGPDEGLLDALRHAGVRVRSSCEAGFCGVCRTRVLAGAIAHHDVVLSDAERAAGNTMMVCVSRAQDELLVLEL